VGLRIATQSIDTTISMGRMVFTALAAVAEMERELTREWVLAGMTRARTDGTDQDRRSVDPSGPDRDPSPLAGDAGPGSGRSPFAGGRSETPAT
jgi:DNA invertase Pin-like site-specific DNA recombinase